MRSSHFPLASEGPEAFATGTDQLASVSAYCTSSTQGPAQALLARSGRRLNDATYLSRTFRGLGWRVVLEAERDLLVQVHVTTVHPVIIRTEVPAGSARPVRVPEVVLS